MYKKELEMKNKINERQCTPRQNKTSLSFIKNVTPTHQFKWKTLLSYISELILYPVNIDINFTYRIYSLDAGIHLKHMPTRAILAFQTKKKLITKRYMKYDIK